jgi:hypothetical protein
VTPMTRLATLTLLGLLLALPLSARAAVPHLVAKGDFVSSQIVEVAGRCGPDRHYVRSHKRPDGHWVKGHCVHNRHR